MRHQDHAKFWDEILLENDSEFINILNTEDCVFCRNPLKYHYNHNDDWVACETLGNKTARPPKKQADLLSV